MSSNLINPSQWCIVANALQKDLEWMIPYLYHQKIIVCDGAYDAIQSWGISIDAIIGDFDSTSHSKLLKNWFHTPDQNKTDLHKAILHADQQGATEIIILNALGNAMSHTLHNLRLLKRLHNPSRSLQLLHAIEDTHSQFPSSGIESIQYVSNATLQLQGAVNASVSLFGFPIGIANSFGLEWDLYDSTLSFEAHDSARNRLAQPSATLSIQNDAILMMDASIQVSKAPIS